MSVIKIERVYTIEYSKGGVTQKADFRFCKDGVLRNHDFRPKWSDHTEIPTITSNNIDEILSVIRGFAYCNEAEITHINGEPVLYYNYLKDHNVKECINELDTQINNMVTGYFNKFILPIINKNGFLFGYSHQGMPILVYYTEDGEVDNIPRDNEAYTLIRCLITDILKLLNHETDKYTDFNDVIGYLNVDEIDFNRVSTS